MQLLSQTTPWGCLITSAAIVLGEKNIDNLIKELGHDGSKELEPGIYQGFHYQEIIDLAFHRGYPVTIIELNPRSESYKTGKVWEVDFIINKWRRFNDYLKNARGIICGLRSDYHAVAWDGEKIYDSGKNIVTDLNHIDMKIDYFLRFDKIIS